MSPLHITTVSRYEPLMSLYFLSIRATGDLKCFSSHCRLATFDALLLALSCADAGGFYPVTSESQRVSVFNTSQVFGF